MILESLIQNEMRVCLDCAKATLVRGAKITIPDEFYQHQDVQGAIKAGFCKLVGDPPVAFAEKPTEKKVKLKNVWKTKIALDCVKGTVEVGAVIEVPESAMTFKEIQNALAWGMLCDPEAPPKIADVASKSVTIEEVQASLSSKKQDAKAPKGKRRAKAITKVADPELSEEKEEEIQLYKESKVIDPSSEKQKKMLAAPAEEKKDEPDRFDFLSIFGEDK